MSNSAVSQSQPANGLDLIEVLSWRASCQPDRLAYAFLEDSDKPICESQIQQITYSQLQSQVNAVARQLCEALASHKSNDKPRIVLSFPAGLQFVVAFFACLRAGCIAVPMPAPGRHRRMQRFLDVVRDAQPHSVLTDESLFEQVTDGIDSIGDSDSAPSVIALEWCDNASSKNEELPPYTKSDIADTALLQYTSGSTGAPKGVIISHGNLIDNLTRIRDCFCHDANSQGVIWLPSYHDMGLIGGILQPLFVGFPVTLMSPASFLRSPLRWLQAIDYFSATTSGGPNFAYEHCLKRTTPEQREQLDLSSWNVAFTGSEVAHAATIRAFTDAFACAGFNTSAWLPCYGMAEVTLFVTGNKAQTGSAIVKLNRKALAENRAEVLTAALATEIKEAIELVGSGQIAEDHQLRIVDPQTCEPLEEKQIGEIWVSGPSVSSGYWCRNDETVAHFSAKLTHDEGLYLRTGDLGFVDDGELYISGRLKELIILRGRNLYPTDIERCVESSHANLVNHATAAFSVDSEEGEQLIIVHEPDRRFERDNAPEVFSTVQAAVADTFEVSVNEILLLSPGRLPRTSSGKIQRAACRQQYIEHSLKAFATHKPASTTGMDTVFCVAKASGDLTRTDVERWISQWLAQRLGMGVNDIDVQRPLAEFGLDSVAGVELADQLARFCGSEQAYNETMVWRYPTIAALAGYAVEEPLAQAPVNDVDVPVEQPSESPVIHEDDALAMLEAELEQARSRVS